MEDKETKQFEKWGKTPPKHVEHGDINEKLERLQPTEWRLEGNRLIGETKMGTLVQNIPTNYILKGTDKNGLPIFEKIK